MSRFRNALFAAASTLFVFGIAPASAQNGAPPPTDVHTSGDWTVRCIHAQSTFCELGQVMVERTHNTKVASISISYIPKSDAYLGRFSVPLGVAFDQGLGLEFGSFRQAGLKYRLCERDGCYVTGLLPTQLLDAMKSMGSDKGAMDIQMIDGRKLQIPIVLNGFGDGLDLLKKWTVEKAGGAAPPAKK
jgi:invasion protein IalB